MLVILISGFTKPDFLWNYLYKSLPGDKIIIFKYKFWEDLNKSTENLNNLIEDQLKKNPKLNQVAVIGHSMGGLIARKALKTDLVVTIASPNKGTLLADYNPLLRKICHSAAQMRTNSSFLRNINSKNKEERIKSYTPTLCLSAEYDLLVYPGFSAFIDGAENKKIPGVGHLGILLNPKTLKSIEDFLYHHHK